MRLLVHLQFFVIAAVDVNTDRTREENETTTSREKQAATLSAFYDSISFPAIQIDLVVRPWNPITGTATARNASCRSSSGYER
jgi:hypothetical protein